MVIQIPLIMLTIELRIITKFYTYNQVSFMDIYFLMSILRSMPNQITLKHKYLNDRHIYLAMEVSTNIQFQI